MVFTLQQTGKVSHFVHVFKSNCKQVPLNCYVLFTILSFIVKVLMQLHKMFSLCKTSSFSTILTSKKAVQAVLDSTEMKQTHSYFPQYNNYQLATSIVLFTAKTYKIGSMHCTQSIDCKNRNTAVVLTGQQMWGL